MKVLPKKMQIIQLQKVRSSRKRPSQPESSKLQMSSISEALIPRQLMFWIRPRKARNSRSLKLLQTAGARLSIKTVLPM